MVAINIKRVLHKHSFFTSPCLLFSHKSLHNIIPPLWSYSEHKRSRIKRERYELHGRQYYFEKKPLTFFVK